MRPTKFVTGSVVDWSGETDGVESSFRRSRAPPVIEFDKERGTHSSMRLTFKLSQGRDRPARLLCGSKSATRLSSNPGLQLGRAHYSYVCNATATHDPPSSTSPHADQISESGEPATDEKPGGELQHPSEAQQETKPRTLPRFVPAVMVGWLHTSTDRGLFVEAEDVDDPDEVLGPLPREIQMAGHELEEEFRRHRLAIVKLGRRRQPFFVTSEDAFIYKEVMMAQPSISPARFELSPRRDAASDQKTETNGKPQAEIIKIASLKTGLSLLCAFPERCCLVRPDFLEEDNKPSVKIQADQQQETRHHQGSDGERGRPLADEAAGAESWRKEGDGMPGTPVFSIPGVYVTIGSVVGPIRMKPLFLSEEQLEGMVETGKRAFTQASLTERRMNREQRRQRILRAFAGIASGGRQPPQQQQGADQDEDEDDGAMDPPEVNEFLGEMGEGPSNRGTPGGFGPARGPIGVVSTAACGVLAMGLGAAGALADLADNAIFATSVGRFLMGHYLPLTIEKDLLEEKVAEAAEHNRIQLDNSGHDSVYSRGPIFPTENASDAPGPKDEAGSEEIDAESLLDPVPGPGEDVESATGHRMAVEDASEASWKQQLDEGLDVVVRKNGMTGGRLTEREVTDRLAKILMRNRHITEVLERLDDNSFTGADVSSIGVILQMAAMVSALQTSLISDSSMEMVLSTGKRTLEGSEKSSAPSSDGRDGAAGPDVTNMEINQKDDGEPDKFRFEISSFERRSGKQGEADGSSRTRSKMQSGEKKAHGESEGDDTSVSIEVDLREALGDLADEFLGDGADGDHGDDKPSKIPAAQDDSSKEVPDPRVQGFVLIGDLIVSDKAKGANVPVDIGNIADVTRLCSISAPTQNWQDSRRRW